MEFKVFFNASHIHIMKLHVVEDYSYKVSWS